MLPEGMTAQDVLDSLATPEWVHYMRTKVADEMAKKIDAEIMAELAKVKE